MTDRPATDATTTPGIETWQRGFVESADRTPIGYVRAGSGAPLIMVHGTTADHTTFRVVGPRFAARHTVVAVDRRGRRPSGDTPPYAIEREFEDVAALADMLAAETGTAVDVVGHSFGGRCALGAATISSRIRRLVLYESAPAPPGASFDRPEVVERLRRHEAAGEPRELLRVFLADVVGFDAAEIAAFEAAPYYRSRLEAAGTVVRELVADASDPEGLIGVGRRVRVPLLQLVGGASPPIFARAAAALDAAIPDGRVVVLPGQKHGAHHGDPDRFVAEVELFLAADE